MVLVKDLKVGSPTEYKHVSGMPLGKFKKGPGWNPLAPRLYEFEAHSGMKITGFPKEVVEKNVVVWERTSAEKGKEVYDLALEWSNKPKHIAAIAAAAAPAAAPATTAGRRRRTHRMMFKKWAAQEAREMSHKGKRMTFRKWAANELKEKSHPGNPSFKKWARQEMREKSHTRRRR